MWVEDLEDCDGVLLRDFPGKEVWLSGFGDADVLAWLFTCRIPVF